MLGSSFGLLTGTVIFFFLELISVIKREQKLNEEKMRYHYETLKNQLNPHFLFNSLNTLSSIIYQDIHLADRFIVKLSSIYRYILDQQESKLVNLENELDFVRDYFYLQQMRDDDRIRLEINIDQPSNYLINIHFIKDMIGYSGSRIKVKMMYGNYPDPIIISRERVIAFKTRMDR